MSVTASDAAQALAEKVVGQIFAADAPSQALGMRIVAVRPGYVRLEMNVTPSMLNGLGTCHGGVLFSLADSAFGLAANTHNHRTIAAACSIEFLAPAHAGDALVAEAVEQALAGRSGVYDVTIANQAGKRIALLRGRSHRLSGESIPVHTL